MTQAQLLQAVTITNDQGLAVTNNQVIDEKAPGPPAKGQDIQIDMDDIGNTVADGGKIDMDAIESTVHILPIKPF